MVMANVCGIDDTKSFSSFIYETYSTTWLRRCISVDLIILNTIYIDCAEVFSLGDSGVSKSDLDN